MRIALNSDGIYGRLGFVIKRRGGGGKGMSDEIVTGEAVFG